MSKRTRRRFSAQDKLRIIRLHLLEKKPISEVCKEEDITPAQFYSWQKRLFEGGASAFEKTSRADPRDRRIGDLEAELGRKVAVIGELAQELVEAKKPLGGS
jgi:transposase-like protein